MFSVFNNYRICIKWFILRIVFFNIVCFLYVIIVYIEKIFKIIMLERIDCMWLIKVRIVVSVWD